MAFDFHYSVTFRITHPRMSAAEVSRGLAPMVPDKHISVGETNVRGAAATSTVWAVSLNPDRMDSEQLPIADCLLPFLDQLAHARDFLHTVAQAGALNMELHCFSNSKHSVIELPHHVMKLASDLKCDLVVEFFEQDDA